MMKKICEKLTQKELERIQIENEINLKKILEDQKKAQKINSKSIRNESHLEKQ